MGDPFLFLRDAVFAVMVLKLFAVFAKGFIEIFVSLAVALAIEEIHPEQTALSIQQLASTFPYKELLGWRRRSGWWSPS